ncbi:hypothetical protein ACFOWZ_30290 [Lentzea rhizosphaerae]|uniref:Uncharacterized protein n=1 Tax=Lentzea rhizosphaerae TaxID=2041025 RepID=A0ABV8C1A9_9PSEU
MSNQASTNSNAPVTDAGSCTWSRLRRASQPVTTSIVASAMSKTTQEIVYWRSDVVRNAPQRTLVSGQRSGTFKKSLNSTPAQISVIAPAAR